MDEDFTPSQEEKLLNETNDKEPKITLAETKKLAFDPSKPLVFSASEFKSDKMKQNQPKLIKETAFKFGHGSSKLEGHVLNADKGQKSGKIESLEKKNEEMSIKDSELDGAKGTGNSTPSANIKLTVGSSIQTSSSPRTTQLKPNLKAGNAIPKHDTTKSRPSGAAKRAKKNRNEKYMENRGNMSASPLCSTPISNKRGRTTPSSANMDFNPNKKLNTNETPTSYAEALSKANLMVAIVDVAEGNALKMIEDNQYFKFLESMNEMHFQCISEGGFDGAIPSFTENRNIRQAIKIRCNDSASRRWLENLVPSLPADNLWEGANLAVIDFSLLPKPITANVWFPGTKRSNADILCILQTCNPGLNSTSWSVIRRKTTDKGTSLKLGICKDSKSFITGKKNRLFFGIAQAVCYFQSAKKKELLQRMNNIDESHLVTDTELESDEDGKTEASEITMVPQSQSSENVKPTETN